MKFFNSQRLKERREGLEVINQLNNSHSKVLIIHYSCESFFNTQGRTPRVTAICIKNRVTNETKSFSIHLKAEKLKLKCFEMTNEDYEKCEVEFLKDFFQYLSGKRGYILLHWRMKNAKYGFEALINRFNILTQKPKRLDWLINETKYDLSKLFEQIYSKHYEFDNKRGHEKGRILNLANRNKILGGSSLTGKEESNAFDSKEYLKMHDSTLQKIDILDEFLNLAYKKELKVASNVTQIYGFSINGIIEIVKNNKLLTILVSVVLYFLGAAFEPIVQRVSGTSEPLNIEQNPNNSISKDSIALHFKLNKF